MPFCPRLPLGMWNDKVDEKAFMNYKYACMLSRVRLFATPWTVACQAPLSMGFSRQEYWSGLPFPPPGNLSDPGIESASPASPVLAGRFSTTEPPGKPIKCCITSPPPQIIIPFVCSLVPLGKRNVVWSLFPAGREAMFLPS